MEEPDKISAVSQWVWCALKDAASLHDALTNGCTKEEFVKAVQRVVGGRPLTFLHEVEVSLRFTRARGANEVPYWPEAGFAVNAHEAAVISAYALVDHIRHAAGLPDTGPVDWRRVDLRRVAKHLATLPPFPWQRLATGMRAEAALALQQWQLERPSKPSVRRLQQTEDRDRWLYEQASREDPPTWKSLMAQLNRAAAKEGWQKLSSAQGVKQAVDRFVKRNHLPPLPPRKEG
jgi:hypothetical protein